MVCNSATLDCEIKTLLTFLFIHRGAQGCGYKGQEDIIKLGTDFKMFVAHKKLHEGTKLNSYVVYKFAAEPDPMGFSSYEPVSRIIHDQDILISPCCCQFIELNKLTGCFEVQKIDTKQKLRANLLEAANGHFGLFKKVENVFNSN